MFITGGRMIDWFLAFLEPKSGAWFYFLVSAAALVVLGWNYFLNVKIDSQWDEEE